MTPDNRAKKLCGELRDLMRTNRTLRIAWDTVPLVMRRQLTDKMVEAIKKNTLEHDREDDIQPR